MADLQEPHAVAGTWDKITLQTRLSYNNGARITQMQIEQRFIDPFQIGDWEHTVPTPDSVRDIPGQVEVIEAVDYEQQAADIENMVHQLEQVKNSAGFNPYSHDNEKIDKEIQLLIEKQVSVHNAVLIVRSVCCSHAVQKLAAILL